MFRFRLLRASFPNIAYFLFKFMVSFFFRDLSAIYKRPFSRHDVPCVLRLLRIETICDCKRHRGKFKMF